MKIKDSVSLLMKTIQRLGETIQPIILLLFRLEWGWQLAQTGLGKLQNHARTAQFFTELGIPLPDLNAWFVGGVELIGGGLLVLGLFSRPAALIVAGNMLVAYLSVAEDRAALFGILADIEPFTTAAPFFFLLTSVLVLAFGPGAVSLDKLIEKRADNREFTNSSRG